jgi:CIC family chloride channel protein
MCALAGAIAGCLTQYIAPEAGGSGIPHVKAVLEHTQSLRGIRILLVKFVGGALVIGTKFSLGREGPTIHLGAALADDLSKRARAPQKLRDHLIACGAGAGLAAAFNAPLAGFLFVIEELRREAHSITIGMALLGAVLADSVVRIGTKAPTLLPMTDLDPPSILATPVIIIIALGATAAGLLFNEALVNAVRRAPRSLPLWVRGALVGCIVGGASYYAPTRPLTADLQDVCSAFLGGELQNSGTHLIALGFGTLLISKIVLTVACYATGVPGGIFAPLLVQGIFVGLVIGQLAAMLPLEVPSPSVCALIGMTALFAASVRAPFTGVVLLAEMTGGFNLLLPLMAAALIAYVVAELSGSKPIYERLMTT